MDGINAVIFDWDGTLIDTAPSSFAAFKSALRDLGIPMESELYERVYSPNWYNMYRALQLPETRWQEADNLWLHHYAHTSAPLVPNAVYVLQTLHNSGYCLGIVTSGNRTRVLEELNSFDLMDIFKAVICHEDVRNKKPHPEGLIMALEQLDMEPKSCCYVGDSPEDIEMGRRAGIQTIGVLSSYPSSRMLPEANPDFFFDSILQLLVHFGIFAKESDMAKF
ncbi:MAG: HAD family hydrolase [Acidobacteria bacterium]|nr:HAD family hydrolase [Acidobacteriota bacterium]